MVVASLASPTVTLPSSVRIDCQLTAGAPLNFLVFPLSQNSRPSIRHGWGSLQRVFLYALMSPMGTFKRVKIASQDDLAECIAFAISPRSLSTG